jgi:hypothetical protein
MKLRTNDTVFHYKYKVVGFCFLNKQNLNSEQAAEEPQPKFQDFSKARPVDVVGDP